MVSHQQTQHEIRIKEYAMSRHRPINAVITQICNRIKAGHFVQGTHYNVEQIQGRSIRVLTEAGTEQLDHRLKPGKHKNGESGPILL